MKAGMFWVWCVAFFLVVSGCGEEEPREIAEPPVEPQERFALECPESADVRPDSLSELVCSTAFSSVAARPDTRLFANTSIVKFVIDLQDDDRVYFVNSLKYRIHYHFCRDNLEIPGLDPVGSHGDFNRVQYRSPERRFLLGTLAFYADQDVIAMEFAAGDAITLDQMRFAFAHIQKHVYFDEELHLRPVSSDHEALAREELADEIPLVFTDDLFQGIHYQPLNPAVSYGYLRVLGEEDPSEARIADIVVLKDVPNDIPPVSGIITEAFQTPLSHVNVLSQNRGTPNMALRDVLSNEDVLALKDKLVRLDVTPQSYRLTEASPADAEEYWQEIRPSSTFVPPLDLEVRGLPDLVGQGIGDLGAIGAKAANLAEMTKIEPPLNLPEEPFAIPFVYYVAHMVEHGLDQRVLAMLEDPRWSEDPAWRDEELSSLRAEIEEAPMSIELKAALHQKILERFGTRRLRFRSSTNSEDLPGFNGAGLYTSQSGEIGSRSKSPEMAVKRVWASLWNDRAALEREFYRIDHTRVAMAVLVHPSFPNESANGVAFTFNPFNRGRPAHYINVQWGDHSVANPDPGEVSDQFLLYTWYEEPELEYLSRSNLTRDGEPVLSWEEVLELSAALTQIHNHFRGIYRPSDPRSWGMDVEFKLESPGRRLLIKQARPVPESR